MATTTKKRAANRAGAKKTAAKKAATPARTEPMRVRTYEDDQITPVGQWKSTTLQGMVIELPSGNFARVKRTLNLALMLEQGRIPNPLADIVREMIASKSDKLPINQQDTELVMKIMAFIDSLMCDIFVNPRLTMQPPEWDVTKQGPWSPPEGALNVDDVDPEDKMYVFAFAQGAALDVATFRNRALQAVANTQHGFNVEDTTVGGNVD